MERVIRFLWIIAGTLSLTTGLIGIIVPILPTTPLIILAGFCFGKSSPALHKWLVTNKYFGHYLQDYQNGKGVPLRIKGFAVVIVWTSVLFTLMIIPLLFVKLFVLAIAVFVSIFIFTSPLLKEKQPKTAPSFTE
ncbi:YbaN family protein [Gracilibacillus caseinilyticus]|uniref:YbaN family protein n=1 Tax=Gracilibacillus caseinilyticus TaxID=2932256 RepID=A0ABY4EVR3_9BACI|nr:YbaN family protein [Gracilibacillus caseinilyticus]UOQ48151.1 YbaN family protein [Gracilibacillus caseinilyticus]